MEKRLQDDQLMRSLPSLDRYSSLPGRNLHKQKARSDVDKFTNVRPKSTLSCYEVKELSDSNVIESEKSEKGEHSDDQNSPLHRDVVHGDAYPDLQLVKEHYFTVGNSTDDKDSEINSVTGQAEESTAAEINSSPRKRYSLPPGDPLKDKSSICGDFRRTNIDRLKSAPHCEVDAHVDAVGGEREHSIDDVFDRAAVDDFVMKTVPSFGKYASLPPKLQFQPKFHSQKTKGEEFLRHHIPEDLCLGSSRAYEVANSDQCSLLDRVGRPDLDESLRLPSCQSKSSSCFDIGQPFEPNPAWLPFKSFDDTIQEFASDSAYQTSDSLKLHSFSLSREELQTKIEHFNLNPDSLKIEMESDTDLYHGWIRVLIDIIRPVDIRTSSRPPSTFDLHQKAENGSDTASFFLPRSYRAKIWITSEATADQVIKDVLNKYNITNNSVRFALFEKINRKHSEGHSTEASSTVYLRKLSNKERPLELCLHSVDENTDSVEERHFLLRENDKSEILWEAFSLPELNMFLDILLQEEESYVTAIREKYMSLRNVLEQKLDQQRRENYDFLVQLQSPRKSSLIS